MQCDISVNDQPNSNAYSVLCIDESINFVQPLHVIFKVTCLSIANYLLSYKHQISTNPVDFTVTIQLPSYPYM